MDNNKIIAKCIKQVLFTLHEFGNPEANQQNIWFEDVPVFTDIWYTQLRYKLLNYYTVKEVREITLYFRHYWKSHSSNNII